MDVHADIRAPSFEQLDHYCECASVAVVRLSVRIFGEETPAGERVAAELGRALLFTNILRGLAEEGRRERLYLPRELLNAHGIFATRPSWVLAQRNFPMSAAIWLGSPNGITRPPPRRLLLVRVGPCARQPSCSVFTAPFYTSSSCAAGGILMSRYEPLPGTNSPS